MVEINCKYKEWLKDYTFENCKLDRGDYGKFLKNYLAGEQDGFVLNLNGAWGTGKTEFLRRLYTLFTTEGHPTIYIDAWESDFSEMPLSVVSSELLNQLSEINENIGTKLSGVSEFLGKALKGAVIGGAGLLTKHLLSDSGMGTEIAKSLFEKTPKDFLDSVKHEHAEQIEAIKNIRTELGNLAEVIQKNYNKQLPVVVLIDELDRCRPSYAIEMLEVIKHFFTTKYFVFVVATDTKQLRESIKSVYGSSFDSTTYLKRFFHREARLEEPKLAQYIELSKIDTSDFVGKVILYPDIRNSESDTLHTYLAWLATAYELSLRDLDQLINKLKGCLRSVLSSYESSGRLQFINIFSLIVAIIEFDKELSKFEDRKDNNPATGVCYLDIDIGSNRDALKISNFYDLNMTCSVMHNIKVTGSFGRDVEKVVCGNYKINQSGAATRYKGLSGIALQRIEHIFASYNDKSKGKLWMWCDYQKLVKLAGRIE